MVELELGDATKALAAGASSVMVGSMLEELMSSWNSLTKKW